MWEKNFNQKILKFRIFIENLLKLGFIENNTKNKFWG